MDACFSAHLQRRTCLDTDPLTEGNQLFDCKADGSDDQFDYSKNNTSPIGHLECCMPVSGLRGHAEAQCAAGACFAGARCMIPSQKLDKEILIATSLIACVLCM